MVNFVNTLFVSSCQQAHALLFVLEVLFFRRPLSRVTLEAVDDQVENLRCVPSTCVRSQTGGEAGYHFLCASPFSFLVPLAKEQ